MLCTQEAIENGRYSFVCIDVVLDGSWLEFKISEIRGECSQSFVLYCESKILDDDSNDESIHKWTNPVAREIFEGYNDKVKELFSSMVQTTEELESLVLSYEDVRTVLFNLKEARRREKILWLIENTLVTSFDEMSMLLNTDSKSLSSLFKSKALMKKVNMHFKLHAQARSEDDQDKYCLATSVDAKDRFELEEKIQQSTESQQEEQPDAEMHDEPVRSTENQREEQPNAEMQEEPIQSTENQCEEQSSAEMQEESVQSTKNQTMECIASQMLVVPKSEESKNTECVAKIRREDKSMSNYCENSYRLRDGFYEWFSNINEACSPSEIMVDTNILMNESLQKMVKNRFVKGWISTITVMELRKLLNNKDRKACASDVLTDIARSIEDEYFYSAIEDHNIRKNTDHDIELIDLAKDRKVTFVTADSGAKVYAWSIGCPCRYYRKTLPKYIESDYRKEKVCLIDTSIMETGLARYIRKNYSGAIITNEFAKMLNYSKYNSNTGTPVYELQIDIATDTSNFYRAYVMRNKADDNRVVYEEELIEICKRENATLVSSDPATIALAWTYGVDTAFYER